MDGETDNANQNDREAEKKTHVHFASTDKDADPASSTIGQEGGILITETGMLKYIHFYVFFIFVF